MRVGSLYRITTVLEIGQGPRALTLVPLSVPSAEIQSCLHWPSKDNNKPKDKQARISLEILLEAEVRLNPVATIGNFPLSFSIT